MHFQPARVRLVPVVLALVICPTAFAARCYVDASAPPGGDGTSWSTAYTALTTAINSSDCSDIWVAKGVYRPGTQSMDAFYINRSVNLFGGFAGTETSLGERVPGAANASVLSGAVAPGTAADSIVMLDSGSSGAFDGFTIAGGGVADVNHSWVTGGGVYCVAGGMSFNDVLFTGNRGYQGGAVYNYGCSHLALTNTTFLGNTAFTYGGALFNAGGEAPTLANVTFSGNSANRGGAIYNNYIGMTLDSATFSGNRANQGGAIYNAGSNPQLTRVILWGDGLSGESGLGAEIYNDVDSTPTIAHSVVQGSGGSGAPWVGALGVDGGGNLDADPLLAPARVNGGSTPTMLLGAGSAAIDAGDACTGADQRGTSRPQGSACDIGAVEMLPPRTCRVRQGATGANDGSSWTDAYAELQRALGDGSCSEVWVAAGVYTPGTKQETSFRILDGVSVHGGFAGTETQRDQRVPALANATVLSGDIDGDDASDARGIDQSADQIRGRNSFHVVRLDGVAGASDARVLDGLTITGGQADGFFPGNGGGGLYCFVNGAQKCSPTLTNITFSGNSAVNGGSGGALFAYENGGGEASPNLANVTFSGNLASGDYARGGAMANIGHASPKLTNVTMSGNASTGNYALGGAIYNDGGAASASSPTLVNVILWGNTATVDADQMHDESATPHIESSIVQGGCPNAAACTNLITASPALGALQDNGGNTPTLLPNLFGSAIDAGSAAACPATDQRGIARPQGAACDVGAVEAVDGTVFFDLSVSATAGGSVSADLLPAPRAARIHACDSSGADGCAASYARDAVVTLTASADDGSLFSGWSGDCAGTDPSVQVTMSAARSCHATFAATLHAIGGNVGGASAGSLSLDLNGSENLPASNGNFAFATHLAAGATYSVTVATTPAGQTCSIANGHGTVRDADIGNVLVSCADSGFRVGGDVNGLAGSGLTLTLNGGSALALAAGSPSFQFPLAIADGGEYEVAIAQQPAGQFCRLANASGTVNGADVVNVALVCSASFYNVGGSVDGLDAGGLVLSLDGGEQLSITPGAASFEFATQVANGSAYAVTIAALPAGVACSIANGSGLVANADVDNITVTCAPAIYSVGGTISGLSTSGLQLSLNYGTPIQVPAGAASFRFPTPMHDGDFYEVDIARQPNGLNCTVGNAFGFVDNADVDGVGITCQASAYYTVGGSVSGLDGAGLTLTLNGGSPLAVAPGSTSFQFATPLLDHSTYLVQVSQQPAGEHCEVGNAKGALNGNDATSVAVTCAPAPTLVLDDGHAFASYGSTVAYSLTLTNASTATTSAFALTSNWSAGFDMAGATWQCLNTDPQVHCTASGTGPFADGNVTLPAGRSVTWKINVPVRADASGASIDAAVQVTGLGLAASDSDTLVIFRDGFDALAAGDAP